MKINVHLLLLADLKIKLASIEAENKSMREEFNVQRAKLKELFLQKEGTLLVFFIIYTYYIQL